nr:MAG TPA: tail completion protein [Caudoviricetes sp.]
MNTQMVSVQDIYEEIARVLRAIFPNLKRVYQERIQNLDTPAMSIELISYRTPQFSQNIINKKVDLDIIYFSKSNGQREALEVLDMLTSAFSMGLTVKDRFLHVMDTPEYKLVDQDLHFLLTFDYQDTLEVVYVTDPDDDNPYGVPVQFGDDKLTPKDDHIVHGDKDSSIKDKSIDFDDSDKKYKYLKDKYQMMQDLELETEELKVDFNL